MKQEGKTSPSAFRSQRVADRVWHPDECVNALSTKDACAEGASRYLLSDSHVDSRVGKRLLQKHPVWIDTPQGVYDDPSDDKAPWPRRQIAEFGWALDTHGRGVQILFQEERARWERMVQARCGRGHVDHGQRGESEPGEGSHGDA